VKVESIVITFIGDNDTRITCAREPNFLWRISGPVYPRVIKLLYTLNEWCREFDQEPTEGK